jgi:hypothetical protein
MLRDKKHINTLDFRHRTTDTQTSLRLQRQQQQQSNALCTPLLLSPGLQRREKKKTSKRKKKGYQT